MKVAVEFELDQLQVGKTVGTVLHEINQFSGTVDLPGEPQQRRQWSGAIAALEQLLQETKTADLGGIILSSPSPLFCDHRISEHYQQVVFLPKSLQEVAIQHLQLTGMGQHCKSFAPRHLIEFPLVINDPLYQEQFCLIVTPHFGFVMVIAPDTGFQFSFDPQAIADTWQLLQWRMALTQPFQFQTVQKLWQRFTPPVPDYRLVSRFSQLMLRSLPETAPTPHSQASPERATIPHHPPHTDIQPELELLQALTHEIRTPLTTIRTMTKLLLKKKQQLTQDIVKRIETIEQECNEQIRRMELIFRAAELETPSQQRSVQLIPTSLDQIFHEGTPRWQKQAQRRNVELDVILPQKLPQVVSDPAMLDQVLSGLIETFTRRLPTGSEVQIQVSTAGNQLKLEVQSQGIGQKCLEKAIGQLLIFQPETGSLSLNFDVTKNLFHALGGKLRIRQRPSGEDVFTIFLPLGNNLSMTTPKP